MVLTRAAARAVAEVDQLTILPDDCIGLIYKHVDDSHSRAALFHTCKALHEPPATLHQICKLKLFVAGWGERDEENGSLDEQLLSCNGGVPKGANISDLTMIDKSVGGDPDDISLEFVKELDHMRELASAGLTDLQLSQITELTLDGFYIISDANAVKLAECLCKTFVNLSKLTLSCRGGFCVSASSEMQFWETLSKQLAPKLTHIVFDAPCFENMSGPTHVAGLSLFPHLTHLTMGIRKDTDFATFDRLSRLEALVLYYIASLAIIVPCCELRSLSLKQLDLNSGCYHMTELPDPAKLPSLQTLRISSVNVKSENVEGMSGALSRLAAHPSLSLTVEELRLDGLRRERLWGIKESCMITDAHTIDNFLNHSPDFPALVGSVKKLKIQNVVD